MNLNLGDWEKHGKGIGAKLMFQMGYQPGKGLGKDLQGIREPVVAHVRKGRAGIGSENETDLVSEENDVKENFRHRVEKQKTIYSYREFREISKATSGRKQRVLQPSFALEAKRALSWSLADKDEQENGKFHLEKLISKLDFLVNQNERKITQNGNEISLVQEQVSAIESQVKNQSRKILKQKEQLTMLTSLLKTFDWLDEQHREGDLDLYFLWTEIKFLIDFYKDEYISFCLANVSLSYVIPLVKLHLSKVWQPFDSDDEECRRLFKRWRRLLRFKEVSTTRTIYGESAYVQKSNTSYFQMDTYDCLLLHAWMPAFRHLVGQWNCKDANSMIVLIESWSPILPDWIISDILNDYIFPKIQQKVNGWDPLTDVTPIHAWIHPWILHLKAKLEIVYPTIRLKMAQALASWTPSDPSARSLLLPWVSVFSKRAIDTFLMKNIVPKLEQAIASWDLNPARQDLDVWHQIMEWKHLLPTQSLVKLLVSHFFPKWLQVLGTWLNCDPSYDEILEWYLGWSALLPQDIVQDPAIEEQLVRALVLMNRSLERIGCQVEYVSPLVITATLNPPEPVVPHNLRELIEYRYAQLGI